MRKKRFLFIDLPFVLFFALLFWKPFLFNVSPSFNIAIPTNKKSVGIDVSHHQGDIAWDKLAAKGAVEPSIDFVFIKATEGLNHIDSDFEYNYTELNKLEIPSGAYHFFLPNRSSIQQANHFLKETERKYFALPPVLDVEIEGTSTTSLTDSVRVWLNHIESKTGKRPLIYCPWHFYNTIFNTNFENYKFWVARYSAQIDFKKHSNIIYWQFTDQADLPYHQTKVDVNVSQILFN
jgi:lysozyme